MHHYCNTCSLATRTLSVFRAACAQYIVSTPFSTDFKYTRFNAVEPIAARNVSLLNGLKALTSSALEESAGSAELHAAPADTPIAR